MSQFKNGAYLFFIATILIFLWWCVNSSYKEEIFPQKGEITYEQLDEIRELATNRDRDYGEILDEIVDKIDEIKNNMKQEWEMQQEINNDKKQEFLDDQQW